LAVRGADWEDVPGVRWDNQGGDEVEIARRVGDSVGVEVTFVGVAAVEDGALHLHAEEACAMRDDDVVGSAVAPRLGDAVSEFGGARHKT